MREKIEKVAAGELSSTVFTFTIEELGLDGEYTASDLGVSSVVDLSSQKVNSAAKSALEALMSKEFASVIRALLEDCPYEMYWYDKTAGTSMSQFLVSAGYSGDGTDADNWFLYIMTESITFSLPVSSDYGSGYTVDHTNLDRVKAARTNAQTLVNAFAGYSDYEKLRAYLYSITALVSYDTSVLYSQSTDYGDIWQIIYVFDGDSSTNVVCEGYAKAFKYLCDLSDFSDSNIRCLTVAGTLSGGAHMWNIVHTSSGNYLVDPTNCDTGAVGAPNQLFMVRNPAGSISSSYTFTMSDGRTVSYSYYDYVLETYSAFYLSLEGTADTLTEEDMTVRIASLTNTSRGIRIRWNQVEGATGYYVYRKTASGSYKKIKTITGDSAVTYLDTAVKSKNGTAYTYKVVPYFGELKGKGVAGTTVRLVAASIKKVTSSASGRLTVKWSRKTKITGYQIQYSTSSSFASGSATKTKKITDAAKISKTLSGLKKGRKYYVRIRTYTKVSGVTYYSAWSSKKSVKVSK